jgi:hypothetical protein
MGPGDVIKLLLNRLFNRCMIMAKTGHCRPAASIKIVFTGGINDVGAVPRHRDRHVGAGLALEQMCQILSPLL